MNVKHKLQEEIINRLSMLQYKDMEILLIYLDFIQYKNKATIHRNPNQFKALFGKYKNYSNSSLEFAERKKLEKDMEL